jgi:hypothetical protein
VKTGKQTRLSPPFDIGASETAVGSSDSKWLVRGEEHFYLTEVGTRNRRLIGIRGDRFRFLSDGRVVVSKSDQLSVYDPTGAHLRVPLVKVAVEGTADGTTAVGIVPAGERLRGTRWDLRTGKQVGAWDGRLPDPAVMNKSHHWRTDLSPDGRVLAVFFDYLAQPGMGFNRIEELHTALFDAGTGRYLSGWWDLHSQADLAFSPDRRTVACYYDSVLGVDIREVMTGKRRTRRSNPPVSSACFSPDGRTLALATQPGPVALWDLLGKPTKWDSVQPEELWKRLAGEDGEAAFDIIRHLRHHPAEAVAFLKTRMKVPSAPAADWIAGRIKELDAAQFRDREQATADLAAVGELIVPELRAALKTAPAEGRRRLDGLLEQAGKPNPETWRAVRACEALEGIGTREARDLLAAWAKGPPAATLTREATESVVRLAERGR